MPRTARIVIPGIPHHVTQRGNRRMQTFFSVADYQRYVDLVSEGCREAGVEVLAYCLMPNHVHLILVPRTEDGLTRALALPHQRYTWVMNRREGWQGHFWQRRFYSCPLDEPHTVAAIRYVELNPVRARLVVSPEQWPWSSVRAHVSGNGDAMVGAGRPAASATIGNWLEFRADGVGDAEAERLRRHQRQGLPLGSDAFVARIEQATRRCLRPLPRGRPPRAISDRSRVHTGTP